MSIKIIGLGAFSEVGRSAILIDTGKDHVLFDYGINVQAGEVPFEPMDRQWVSNLDGVFISHAHLDHSGHIPFLYKRGYEKSVFATRTTHDLCSILLRDSIKVQEKKGEQPKYSIEDILTMERKKKYLEYGQKTKIGASSVEFHDAGHVPGAAVSILEYNGKRILYTGDIKFIDTSLIKGARSSFKDIDVVICEATYPFSNHSDRNALSNELKKKVEETCNSGGITILPCFAVGRTQEMMIIMDELGIPLYLDGMGISVTRVILSNPKSIRFPEKLKKAFGKAKKISGNRQRMEAIKKPGIIITTSGMLNGGPVNFYIKKLHKREDCSLFLTGFQVPGTVGHTLVNTGRYVNEGFDIKPRFRIEHMDFSAHCDRSHILEFLKNTSPEKIILVHGDSNQRFAEDLKSMGFDARAPKNYEVVEVCNSL